MAALRRAFDFFVFGNSWVGLCAVAQGLLTYVFIRQTPSLPILGILLLATFLVYNLRVILNYTVIRQNRNRYISDRMRCVGANVELIRILTALAALLLLPMLFFISKGALFALIVAGLLTLAYSLPFLQGGKGGLREILGLKTIIISLIWALSTVLVPILDTDLVLSLSELLLLLLNRFFLVFGLAMVFDIRDIAADRANGLRTIANQIGPERAKWFCMGIMLLNALLFIGRRDLEDQYGILGALLLFVSIVCWFINRSYPKRSDYFYLFWIDGMFVLQYLLVQLTTNS